MLSVEKVKQLLDDSTITDVEVEAIRDGFHQLSELIFNDWREKENRKKCELSNNNK